MGSQSQSHQPGRRDGLLNCECDSPVSSEQGVAVAGCDIPTGMVLHLRLRRPASRAVVCRSVGGGGKCDCAGPCQRYTVGISAASGRKRHPSPTDLVPATRRPGASSLAQCGAPSAHRTLNPEKEVCSARSIIRERLGRSLPGRGRPRAARDCAAPARGQRREAPAARRSAAPASPSGAGERRPRVESGAQLHSSPLGCVASGATEPRPVRAVPGPVAAFGLEPLELRPNRHGRDPRCARRHREAGRPARVLALARSLATLTREQPPVAAVEALGRAEQALAVLRTAATAIFEQALQQYGGCAIFRVPGDLVIQVVAGDPTSARERRCLALGCNSSSDFLVVMVGSQHTLVVCHRGHCWWETTFHEDRILDPAGLLGLLSMIFRRSTRR